MTSIIITKNTQLNNKDDVESFLVSMTGANAALKARELINVDPTPSDDPALLMQHIEVTS